MQGQENEDPLAGLSIESIVGTPLVDPDDVRTQGEIDQFVLAAMLDQGRREYAGAKLLLSLLKEHQPDNPEMGFFEGKVAHTRLTVATLERLLKTGLPDPVQNGSGSTST